MGGTVARVSSHPFGVYVHVPFCASRCDYCAFATWTDRGHLVEEYVRACCDDLNRRAGSMPPATSVFFGGGTPSAIPAASLASILAGIERDAGCEVTVECNPETVTPELLDVYCRAGVTRISLGVQSTVPSVLEALGRRHDPATVVSAVAAIRAAGFESFNLDCIYGAAGEGLDDWRRTLEEVLALEPPHLSAYALTVEAGTPLAAQPHRHPDDDDQADKYLLADEVLGAAGMEWYEVSNWARPGHECRHNRLYWTMGEYQGIGCAAHSHRDGTRSWNVRTPERYIAGVRTGRDLAAGQEHLSGPDRVLEGLQLALRTRAGVPLAALAPDDADVLAGLVEVDGHSWVLTRRGRLLANEVALRLRTAGEDAVAGVALRPAG